MGSKGNSDPKDSYGVFLATNHYNNKKKQCHENKRHYTLTLGKVLKYAPKLAETLKRELRGYLKSSPHLQSLRIIHGHSNGTKAAFERLL